MIVPSARLGARTGAAVATLAPVSAVEMFRRLTRPMARTVVSVGAAAGVVLLAASAASASSQLDDQGEGLTVVQTFVLYVAAPLVIFGLIALIVVGPSLGKGPRHRTGASLETGPVWIDPAGARRTSAGSVTPDLRGPTEQGGTSAHW